MHSDNGESKKIRLSFNLIGLENQFLDVSILLDRWSKWAKTFSSFMYEEKDFVQLQKDTEKFFNSNKREE